MNSFLQRVFKAVVTVVAVVEHFREEAQQVQETRGSPASRAGHEWFQKPHVQLCW